MIHSKEQQRINRKHLQAYTCTCNVQRLVIEKVLFVLLGFMNKRDSSWLSDEKGQLQCVSLSTIYQTKLDILYELFLFVIRYISVLMCIPVVMLFLPKSQYRLQNLSKMYLTSTVFTFPSLMKFKISPSILTLVLFYISSFPIRWLFLKCGILQGHSCPKLCLLRFLFISNFSGTLSFSSSCAQCASHMIRASAKYRNVNRNE